MRLIRLVTACALLLVAGCSTSTRFVSTWKEPSVGPSELAGKKIAVFLLSPQESTRRAAEDAMAREINSRGAQGTPGYSLMTAEEAQNHEMALSKLRNAGFDNIVTLKPVGARQEITATPAMDWDTPHRHRRFGGYWGSGWSSVNDPTYLRTDTIVSIEVMIYRVKTDMLVFAGQSETRNRSEVDALIHDLANALDDVLVESGLLRAN